MSGTCSVENCTRDSHCRGWCNAHYQRWCLTGDLQVDVPLIERQGQCSAPECDQRARCKNLCNRHYLRFRKFGTTDLPPTPTDQERFEEGVDRSGDCHIWKEGKCRNYGHFRLNGQDMGAHQAAWTLANGPIPDGLWVLHTCDNPKCVRVDHLWLGTMLDNIADMVAKGRNRTPVASGEASPRHKVTARQVDEIRVRYAAGGVTQQALADEYGLTQSAISAIVRRRSWSQQPVPFQGDLPYHPNR